MKNLKYISIVLVALLALVGCKETMRELNTNTDLVDDTTVPYQFSGATQNFDFSGSTTDNFYAQLHQHMQYLVYYTLSNDMYRNPDLSGAVTPGYINGVCYSEIFSNNKGNRLQSIINYIDDQLILQPDKYETFLDVRAICSGLLAFMQWRILENYGATVYNEAFQAINLGITQPEYEFIEDLYVDILAELKASVDQLAKPAVENVCKLGNADFFAGYKSVMKEGRGLTVSTVSNYEDQRAAWKRFFNMTRLDIAFKVRLAAAGDPDFSFDNVFNEVSNVSGGYITNVDEGFYYLYAHDYGSGDDYQEGEQNYVASESFLNVLKRRNDPRLPYLARPNGANEFFSPSFNVMKDYFADSLEKYGFFDGKHPYMGLTPNISRSGETMFNKEYDEDPETRRPQAERLVDDPFLSGVTFRFNKLKNPAGTAEFKIFDPISGDSMVYCDANKDVIETLEILIASQSQFRYWVVCGGRHEADHNYHGNGLYALGDKQYSRRYHSDGDTPDQTGAVDLAVRERLFTYARQCFMLSLIAQETGKNFAGKDAAAWYNEAVKAAFDELQGEACRVGIQAYTGGDQFGSTNKKYPASLTQIVGDPSADPLQEATYNFPYTTYNETAEAHVGRYPYSKDNLNTEMYLYGYIDPYAAYNWWRMTGYPQTKKHATAFEASCEEQAYLETPTVDETQDKLIPRRACLPDQTALNENFTDAKNHLLGMPGFKEWNETEGCIWWEYPYFQQQ